MASIAILSSGGATSTLCAECRFAFRRISGSAACRSGSGRAALRPRHRSARTPREGARRVRTVEDVWAKNLTITTGLVDTYSTPTLIGLVASHQRGQQ